jgi:hypothetical protein
MTGYLDDEGREHWTCWRAEGCDSTDRPLDAPARLRATPVQRFDAAAIGPKRARSARAATTRTRLRTSSPVGGTAAAGQLSLMKRWHSSAVASVIGAVIAVLVVAVLAAAAIVAWQAYAEHAPRSVYSHTLCLDGWISHSQGPGTCSYHSGVARYVYVEVTAPPAGWSSVK